jgi:hypothetical protein
MQLVDTLDLDDDGILDEEIEAIFSEGTAFVNGRNGQLSAKDQALFGEFDRQRFFVDSFEKARTEFPMHGDSAADDALGQRIPLGVHKGSDRA